MHDCVSVCVLTLCREFQRTLKLHNIWSHQPLEVLHKLKEQQVVFAHHSFQCRAQQRNKSACTFKYIISKFQTAELSQTVLDETYRKKTKKTTTT